MLAVAGRAMRGVGGVTGRKPSLDAALQGENTFDADSF
jgi:hypothetical protein